MQIEAIRPAGLGRILTRTRRTLTDEERQRILLAEIRAHVAEACPDYKDLTKTVRHFAARYVAVDKPDGMVLGITSAGAGEGRTTVAVGLAGALADMCPNVVLVELDADPDRPGLSEELQLPPGPRLGGCHVLPTAKENLWLLPASQTEGHNGHSAARATGDLLTKLREQFAITVVDVPALLASEEAPAVVGQLDSAVLVVAAGSTTSEEVEQAIALLGSVPLKGILLNQVREEAPRWIASLLHDA